MNKCSRAFMTVIGMVSMAHMSVAASLVEASRIYRENFKDSPPSVQESGEYLFIIVEDDEDKSEDGSLNALILSAQLDALEKYVGGKTGVVVSPFLPKVTEQLMPWEAFTIPNARRFSIERKRTGIRFRDVTAFELAPIKEARDKVVSGTPTKRTFDDWVSLLHGKRVTLKASDEKLEFYSALGATIPMFFNQGGVICFGDSVDYMEVVNAVGKWNMSARSPVEAEDVLKICPSCSEAWAVRARIDAKNGDLIQFHINALRANTVAGDYQTLVRSSIERLAEKYDGVWNEYGKLFADVQEKSEVFKNGTCVQRYALHSFGRMQSVSRPRNDDGAFREAQLLFNKGENLPRILSLLGNAVEAHPGHALAWRFYGAALRTAGKMHDAVIAYHQALFLDPTDKIASADLCVVYKKLQKKHLADGNAWYLICTSDDAATIDKAKRIIIANHNGKFEE